MWNAQFEDGSSASSSSQYWTDIPEGKRVAGLQLRHPNSRFSNMPLAITDLDQYYFVTEAIATPFEKTPRVVAEIIGGHDLELGTGVEVEVGVSGVRFRVYPVSKFRYDRTILRKGTGKNKQGKPLQEAAVKV